MNCKRAIVGRKLRTLLCRSSAFLFFSAFLCLTPFERVQLGPMDLRICSTHDSSMFGEGTPQEERRHNAVCLFVALIELFRPLSGLRYPHTPISFMLNLSVQASSLEADYLFSCPRAM